MAPVDGYPERPSHASRKAKQPQQRWSTDQIKDTVPIEDFTATVRKLRRIRDGEFRYVTNCVAHPDKNPSMKIEPGTERKPGHAHCFSCGFHGSVIDVAIKAHGLTLAEACDRLQQFAGGIPPSPSRPASSSSSLSATSSPPPTKPAATPDWRKAWDAAQPVDPKGAVARYFVEDRQLRPPAWDFAVMREHKTCPWEGGTAHCLLVVAQHHETDAVLGVHRFRLPEHPGQAMGERRKSWGPVKGGLARVCPVDPEATSIAIAEGVEDARAFRQITGISTYSGLSASLLRFVDVPKRFTQVWLIQDNDPPNADGSLGAGPEAMQKLAVRLQDEGRHVEILSPIGFKDANDLLRELERMRAAGDPRVGNGAGAKLLESMFETVEIVRSKRADPPPDGLGGAAEADEPTDDAEKVAPLAAWTMEEMRALPPPSWIIENYVQAGTRGLLFAPSGHHKTNVAVDRACCVAHGMSWHGHATVAHPMVVVATEDPTGAAMRVLAWHDFHDMPPGRVIVVHGGEMFLNDADSIERAKATARAHFGDAKVGYLVDHYDVVVLGDPTNTEEAKDAAAGLRQLSQDAAFVLLLAHTPWTTDGRAKVPVALWANVDFRERIERDAVTGRAILTPLHQKNGRAGAVLRFDWLEHEFELKQGKATALIAQRVHDGAAGEAPKPSQDGLGGNERIILQALTAAIVDQGREPPQARDIPSGMKAVRFEEWVTAAERYTPPGKEPRRWRRDFDRCVTTLRTKDRYKLVAGWVWVPPRT